MNHKEVNTIIIGGGPAGSSCGIELLKGHNDVCIIDKAIFPRKKLCGGLVTEKTIDALKEIVLEFDISKFVCNHSNFIEMFNGNEKIVETDTNTKLYFTERDKFDNELIQYYKKMGGNILENTKIIKIDTKNRLVYTSGDKIIRYNYLIGADGANSLTRKKLGMKLNSIGFSLEVDIPKNKLKDINNNTQIHFGILENGYGWVFPKGDYYTIGIGNKYSKSVDYKKILFLYLEILGICNFEEIVPKGAFIPFGDVVENPVGLENIFLVGDAAGLVDPINGEGIYFALSSGREAAKAILSDNTNKTLEYLKRFKNLKKYVVEGNKLQKTFYKPFIQKIFYKLAKEHPNFVKFYCDNQISYYNYSYKKIALFPIYYYIDKFSKEGKDGYK